MLTRWPSRLRTAASVFACAAALCAAVSLVSVAGRQSDFGHRLRMVTPAGNLPFVTLRGFDGARRMVVGSTPGPRVTIATWRRGWDEEPDVIHIDNAWAAALCAESGRVYFARRGQEELFSVSSEGADLRPVPAEPIPGVQNLAVDASGRLLAVEHLRETAALKRWSSLAVSVIDLDSGTVIRHVRGFILCFLLMAGR